MLGVTLILFVMLHFVPGGPMAMYLNSPTMTAAEIKRMEHVYGLDKPLYQQYLSWLGNMLHGNFGTSYASQQPVTLRIAQRLPATLELMGSAFGLALVVAVPVGILGALHQYSAADYITTVLSYIGISMPDFWFGIMMIMFFAARLHWLPATGDATPGVHTLGDHLKHLIMPAVVLSFYIMASWSRYVRSSMLDVVRQDYVRTARAKGLVERAVIYRHTLKNALIPVVTIVALDLAFLFSGALIAETIFGWPGMGRLFWDSVTSRDYPVLMGILTFSAVSVIVFNLLADVLYGVLDPRIRYD